VSELVSKTSKYRVKPHKLTAHPKLSKTRGELQFDLREAHAAKQRVGRDAPNHTDEATGGACVCEELALIGLRVRELSTVEKARDALGVEP